MHTALYPEVREKENWRIENSSLLIFLASILWDRVDRFVVPSAQYQITALLSSPIRFLMFRSFSFHCLFHDHKRILRHNYYHGLSIFTLLQMWRQQIIFKREEESLASSLLNIICLQNWYQSKSDYMDHPFALTLSQLYSKCLGQNTFLICVSNGFLWIVEHCLFLWNYEVQLWDSLLTSKANPETS